MPMEWLAKIRDIFKVQVVVVAVVGLLLTSLAAHYILLRPRINDVARMEKNLHLLQKHYRRMEMTDMKSISEILSKQVKYLKTKEKNVFQRAPSEEELPLLISKLEDRASQCGLTINSQVNTGKGVKNSEQNKSKEFRPISIQMTYVGSFLQVLDFLHDLETFDKRLLISEFEIKRQSDVRVSGELKFFTMVASRLNVKT